MDVILPETGCNVLVDDSHIINYDYDNQLVQKYSIYEGVIHLYESQGETVQNIYSDYCLNTGDLVYSPSNQVWFVLSSCIIFLAICFFIYKITIGRFIK